MRKTFLPFIFFILGSQNVCNKAQEEKRSEVEVKAWRDKEPKVEKALGGVGVPVLGANQARTHTVATIKKANTLFTS